MTRVVSCSLTAAGAEIAQKLPYEHRQGNLVATVSELWGEVDGLVLISATGIAVRAIAPHLRDKSADPAVVCVDETAGFAVSLSGGHTAGANRLAQDVAGLTGAVPVITTASDLAGVPGLDILPGFTADGDTAGVTRKWLDGQAPALLVDEALRDWPLPERLRSLDHSGTTRVVVTDRRAGPPPTGEVRLHPRSLVLGAGSSSGANPESLWELALDQLRAAGLDPACVGVVATADLKLNEPALNALADRLGASLTGFAPAVLATVEVPNPSRAVADAVGTASVAEAAALLAGGPGAELVSPKAISSTSDSTVAIVRRRAPAGHLAVVGVGPGAPAKRTFEATAAIRSADVVIGFTGYVDLVEDLIEARHEVIRRSIGEEEARCREALKLASEGRQVALVCSGDPGVYAMASLVCEVAPEYGDPPLTVLPGVTAALSGASVLGGPLGHDHAAISLSDLLTPWEVILRRLRAVAEADFVVSLYNPRSERRTRQLKEALEILGEHREPSTPAAVLTDIGRPGETVVRTVLSELDVEKVGMLSLVVIGSTSTRWVGDRMVTPRGYGKPDR